MNPVSIVKTFEECTPTELEEFFKLVKMSNLHMNVDRSLAKHLGFLKNDNELLGIGAIKKPKNSYVCKISEETRFFEMPKIEFGYLLIKSSYRRQGLAKKLMDSLLSIPRTGGIFATTHKDNVVMVKLLEKYGFNKEGRDFLSRYGRHKLCLFVNRNSQAQNNK